MTRQILINAAINVRVTFNFKVQLKLVFQSRPIPAAPGYTDADIDRNCEDYQAFPFHDNTKQ